MIIRKPEELIEYLEPTQVDEIYHPLDEYHECMGDITYFWNGKEDFTECCSFALLGVPDDKSVICMNGPSGAYEGPYAFRKEFYRLCNHYHKPKKLMVDLGNIRIDLDSDVTSTHRKLSAVISFLLKKGIFPIVIGGASDITYAGVDGLKNSGLFRKIGLVSIDAHVDLLDIPHRFAAECTMKKIIDKYSDFVNPRNIFYFGVRKERVSPYSIEIIEKNRIRINYKDTIGKLKNDFLFALNTAFHGTDGIVVSFDLDSCDAGMMPGTSFPMPGGFTPQEVILLAKALSKCKMLLYMDIVELNPKVDINNITAVMAALFLFHFLEKK